ncbi:hypothetical protein KF840_04925 [bacterium]|nr:hypothetical protein [bacterium]
MKGLLGGCLALALALAAPASALVIGGGGSPSTDCLLALSVDANYPLGGPKQVRCVDGDASCDDDGAVNGVCSLRIALCANSTLDPSCTLSGLGSVIVAHAQDNGDPQFDPDFQSLQNRANADFTFPVTSPDTCTTIGIIRVPIKGPLGSNNSCGRRKKKLQLRALSTGGPNGIREDKDTLKLSCDPAPANGCDPQALFGGTFDRIQRQVFNQSCAVSGCHDSQAQSGNLLLESGAAYGNLVNQTPSNPSALTAGWRRVDVVPGVSGNLDASYLVRKLAGDLPDATYGARMPFNRGKLNGSLRDLIARWIQAGAPPTGWVPGTF